MEEVKSALKRIISEAPHAQVLFRRNLLKEYLQLVLLDFIYAHPGYGKLVFYGGSCLAHCYGLPRLSEDLDFVDLAGSVDLKRFSEDVLSFINEKTDVRATGTVQQKKAIADGKCRERYKRFVKAEVRYKYLKVVLETARGQLSACQSLGSNMRDEWDINKQHKA